MEGSADFDIQIVDFSDTLPPTAVLDDAISEKPITSFADIVGTVTDDGDVEYVLEVAPVAGGDFVEIASGSSAVENGKLGSFDPSLLQNDSYVLRLTATDAGNNTNSDSVVVDVTGDLKLGNFRLSFTDLEIPVSGIPISVTRTYDSLNASERDDFGYGWRLEFRDTDLKTSVRRRTTEEELLGVQSPFSEGERVYVTLPGGERTGFTFKPRSSHLNGYLSYPEAFMYHPEFVADDGSELTLRVKDVNLVRKTGTDEFVENGSGVPYNPTDPRFGGVYELVTKEGVVYTIDAVSGDLLTVTDRNENKLTFTDAGIVSSTGVAVTFERDAKGRIVGVVDPEGNRIGYEYDEFGDLVGVTDREDNTTEFVYDLDERPHFLEEIIDPLGRSGVKTEYDEKGRLQRMLDVNGEAVELVYDPDNSTQTVRDVFGNPTTYVYDERGNVVTEVDAVGKVVKRTYDGDNNVLTETVVTDESEPDGWTTTFTYDVSGNKLTETDPLGNTTRWTYNRFGQVLTETDPLGNTTTNTYSPNGNLLSVTDAEGNVTNFSYDIRGNLLSVTDAKNRVTQFQYDLSGNVLETTDALGGKTVYSYDSMGNRLSETRTVTVTNGVEELVSEWDYDNEGQVLSMTDATGNVTKYEYDAAGNQIAVIDALGRRTESVYDEKGQLVETIYPDETPNNSEDNYRTIEVYDKGGQKRASIDESGRVTHYRYDAVGQLVETFYPDGMDTLEQFVAAIAPGETDVTVDWSEVVYPDAMLSFVDDNPSSKTEYDKNGRVKAQIDELGNRALYRYDDSGRLLETIYPDDTPLDLSDNPRSRVEYDNAGRRIKDIDAIGRVTEFVYDELGRVKETLLADGTSTQTVYDAVGQKVADIDQLGNRTEFEYDSLGRLTDVVQYLNPDGENKEIRTEYGYDELGRQVWQEDALDRRTLYEYDLMGRRTAVVLPMGQRSSTVYDAVGNVSRATDFNGETIVYSYDPLNRLTFIDLPNDADVSFTYTPTGLRESVTDERGVTSYAYDERNRLIGRTDAGKPYLTSGATIEYEYDDAGNRTLVRTPGGVTRYEFDERNQLEKVVADGGETVYEYDAVGNLVKTVLPNGVVESRSYDELNRLEFLENLSGDAVVSSYDYELDDVGNRVAVTEHDGRRVEYVYDSLYRLVSEEVVGQKVVGYVYDDVGNRLQKVDSVETTYRYDDNDQLHSESSGGEVVVYEYDDNGNTISETVNGVQETVYVWDDRNRLVEVRFADGKVVGYGYDDGGIRVSEVVDGVETRFLLDKNRAYAQVLEEYVDGMLDAEYVYGLDLISQTRGGVDSFYLVDGLGSVRGLTDASGGVVAGYSYDAFGNLVGSSGDVENDYLFAGEQFDGELDQYYLRQRFYDSGVGRFTRRDVYEGELNQPITLHKYLYGNGNPVNYVDPSGLISTGAAQPISNLTILGILLTITGSIGIAVSSIQTAEEEKTLTFYRGTTYYNALETLSTQHIDVERIRESQARNGYPPDRQGVYFTSQLSTAQYYASLAGRNGKKGGPGVTSAFVSEKPFQQFVVRHGIAVELPVPSPPAPGQTETIIPYDAMFEFETFTTYGIV